MATAGFLGQLAETSERNRQRKESEDYQDKVALRERKADEIEKAIQGIQQRGALQPGQPGYLPPDELKRELDEAQKQLSGLYEPHEGPDLMKRLKGIFGKKNSQHAMSEQPNAPGVPSSSGIQLRPGMTLGEILAAGAPTPAPSKLQQQMDDIKAAYKATFGTDMSPEDEQTFFNHLAGGAPMVEKGNWETVAGSIDGKPITLQHNKVDGTYTDLNGNPVDATSLVKFIPSPKGAAAKHKTAWRMDAKTGKPVSVQLDDNNQVIPGSENPDLIPPSSMLPHLSHSVYMYTDNDGKVHEVPITRSTGPVLPGGKTGTGKEKKSATANVTASASSLKDNGDKIVGSKGDKDLHKDASESRRTYKAAVDRVKVMDQNYQDALKTGSQQAMISLLANHIGMTLGLQKGARITRAVWEEAAASTNWWDSKMAKFFHQDENGDYIFDGYKGGVTLTKQQMYEMVKLAHDRAKIAKERLTTDERDYRESFGAGSSNTPPPPKKGDIVDGHEFLGGKPSDPKSWKEVKKQ